MTSNLKVWGVIWLFTGIFLWVLHPENTVSNFMTTVSMVHLVGDSVVNAVSKGRAAESLLQRIKDSGDAGAYWEAEIKVFFANE